MSNAQPAKPMNQADLIIAKAKAMDLLMEFAEDFHSEDLEGLSRTDQFIEVYKKLKSEVAALTAEVARLKGVMIRAAGRLVVNRPEDEEGWLKATRVMREVAIQLRDAAALADTEPEDGGE